MTSVQSTKGKEYLGWKEHHLKQGDGKGAKYLTNGMSLIRWSP